MDMATLPVLSKLKNTNVVELTIRDFTAPAAQKPRLSARNAVITIMPRT